MKPKPKMKRILITVRQDQYDSTAGTNRSGYIQKLIDNDRNQVVKLNYAGQLIADYMNNHDAVDLATLFAKRLAGIDVLAELMEGGGK